MEHRPRHTPLFGSLLDLAYVAPSNDWFLDVTPAPTDIPQPPPMTQDVQVSAHVLYAAEDVDLDTAFGGHEIFDMSLFHVSKVWDSSVTASVGPSLSSVDVFEDPLSNSP